jgi:uncharacterized protein DUF3617
MFGQVMGALLGFVFVAEGAAPEAPRMVPGMWEIRMRVDVPDGPVQEVAETFRHCYTETELEDMRNTVPRTAAECEVMDYQIAGDRATWSLRCDGPEAVTGGGEMIFGRNVYAAKIWHDKRVQNRALHIVQRIRGRRIGDCGTKGPGE